MSNREAEYLRQVIKSIPSHSRVGNIAKLGEDLQLNQMVKEWNSKARADGAKQQKIDFIKQMREAKITPIPDFD